MASKFMEPIRRNAGLWLSQGISARRLSLTLALGLAVGCIPVVGIPTALCAALALALRLNLPAIQAANYIAMPLQLVLIVPFVRLGSRLFATGNQKIPSAGALLHASPLNLLTQLGSLTGHAMLAWLLVAIPAVALLTAAFNLLLRRVPALAEAEAAE